MALFMLFLFTTLLLVAIVQADHNETDFLSIDCGSSNSSYTDKSTGFLYLSDANFVMTGENREIAEAYKAQLVNQTALLTVRSFSQGNRNCYAIKLTLTRGTKYMIRARFLFGEYDNETQLPSFDLYLGDDLWSTVVFPVAWVPVDKEIVFFPRSSDDIQVCVVNTGFGTPFISALEVRPWDSETYVSETGSLQLVARIDLNPSINQIMRYTDDDYDRLWAPLKTDEWKPLNITDGKNIIDNIYKIPFQVMATAYTPNMTTGNLELTIDTLNSSRTSKFQLYFHFAELELLPKNELREFNVVVNGDLSHRSFAPIYMETTTLVTTTINNARDGKIRIWLNQTSNSTQPPILNAVEIYSVSELTGHKVNLSSGFLSIDCGSSKLSYFDDASGFLYLSDEGFVETGENWDIAQAYKEQIGNDSQPLLTVRSFPQGTRNCYTLMPTLGKGIKYMIRARFIYGNYDGKGKSPTFDLYFGANRWDTVIITTMWGLVDKEITFTPEYDDYPMYVCLVNTDFGVPFISALELRPWDSNTYVSETGSLQLVARIDLNPLLALILRYSSDGYDRSWSPFTTPQLTPINTTDVNNITGNIYQIPSPIMSTAYTSNATEIGIGLNIKPTNSTPNSRYYYYFHFAELQLLSNRESREFNIFTNGNLSHGPFRPTYMATTTLVSTLNNTANDGVMRIWLNRTRNSTHPPLLNALEIYVLSQLSKEETEPREAKAILKIKTLYGVKRISWQGDPCVPTSYMWEGLICTHSNNHLPTISSLNLSSAGLKGEISDFANLTSLEYLDLSNNNLTGKLPKFLAELPVLRVLNLKGNNLEGPVPAALHERQKNGLTLSVDDNVLRIEPAQPPHSDAPTSSALFLREKDSRGFQVVALFSIILAKFILYN